MPAKRKTGAPPENLWERQPGETARSFAAFCAYRDLGPRGRGVNVVAQNLNVSRTLIAGWSAEHEWVRRAEAYDDFLDRERRAAELEAMKEMTKRHVDLGRALASASAVELRKLLEEVQEIRIENGRPVLDAKGNPKLVGRKLRPKEIRELAELGTKIERLARGEPTEISKGETTVRYTYADLMRKALERSGENDGHG